MTNFRRLPLFFATIALAAVLALALFSTAPPATAVVPPKDCKTLTKKGQRYNIKADQITCATARRYAASYLTSGRRPSGYTCQQPRGSKIAFRCLRGIKSFFAIRR